MKCLSYEDNSKNNLGKNMEIYDGEKTWGKISVFRKTNIQWIKSISMKSSSLHQAKNIIFVPTARTGEAGEATLSPWLAGFWPQQKTTSFYVTFWQRHFFLFLSVSLSDTYNTLFLTHSQCLHKWHYNDVFIIVISIRTDVVVMTTT